MYQLKESGSSLVCCHDTGLNKMLSFVLHTIAPY